MKIFAVFILYFAVALCDQNNNWHIQLTATNNQTYPPLTNAADAGGSCIVTLAYDNFTDNPTVAGWINCTKLSSEFQYAHIHYTDIYPLPGNSGGVLVTLYDYTANGTTPGATSVYFNVSVLESDILDNVCYDETYINVHTAKEPNGEVRANIVGMPVVCGTGKSGTQLNTSVLVEFDLDTTADGDYPGFASDINLSVTGGGSVKGLLTYWDGDFYFSGIATNVPGNVLVLNYSAPGQTQDSFYEFFSSTSDSAWTADNDVPFSFWVSVDYTDIENVFGAAPQQNYVIYLQTDQVTATGPLIFPTVPLPVGQTTSPTPAPSGTPSPTTPTAGPTHVPTAPTVPTAPVAPTASGFTLHVTLLFTLMFTLISMWF